MSCFTLQRCPANLLLRRKRNAQLALQCFSSDTHPVPARSDFDPIATQRKREKQNQTSAVEKVKSSRSQNDRLFVQAQPAITNPYDQDTYLQRYLKRTLPVEVFVEVSKDLSEFGRRAGGELVHLHRQCELEPPYLRKYDPWGNRVDEIVTSPAWKRMHDIAAEEGLVAIAYERKYGQWSRIYQVAKNYIFASTSGMYSCPLAMTDGAAKIIESTKKTTDDAVHLDLAFSHLTSRDPQQFWTSGQWMTERRGGSDVANGTETTAVPLGPSVDCDRSAVDHPYRTHQLFGNKWFSSATDSNMTFTLAREEDADGCVTKGTKGLSLFYLETRGHDNLLNGIEIRTLKNKLGTRQLPTAELSLQGTFARLIGQPGRGVPTISKMLTVTRLHNAISAVSYMRRILTLARDYASKRIAFGTLLKDHPLHMRTLATLELETRGAMLMLFEVARLLGLEETGKADSRELQALRVLTPLLKLYTAKQAVWVVSEGLECFGGQGFIEDTGIPNILRDAQVLPIWEGTTNVLALDVIRALTPDLPDGVVNVLGSKKNEHGSYNDPFDLVAASPLAWTNLATKLNLLKLIDWQKNAPHPDMLTTSARDFAYTLGLHYIGVLLLEAANNGMAKETDTFAASEWINRGMSILKNPPSYSDADNQANTSLVMEGYTDTVSV
ncbi:Acyl-CoA dehydrogenase family member 11 [Hypsibius exemplaris]|uniref:Acyl-CoA dehydrogenase family member 11 n=1 Tax=Hypsibius exemplaris TaxID=2072580 RepID=A0A1W0X971_HYPEX|nr:Acyl-CoA dehydrogenase family member 11 [Hypsibius exemplaris]